MKFKKLRLYSTVLASCMIASCSIISADEMTSSTTNQGDVQTHEVSSLKDLTSDSKPQSNTDETAKPSKDKDAKPSEDKDAKPSEDKDVKSSKDKDTKDKVDPNTLTKASSDVQAKTSLNADKILTEKQKVALPTYSQTKPLLPNSENKILKPQDYLIVYDYFGMDKERQDKGFEILKAAASKLADGSRFMIHMTKSQLANHSMISDDQATTGLLSKEELLAAKSPQDLINKKIKGSGAFYDYYQNNLRGNSDHDISALYIFDNWTPVDPSNPKSEKENYDLNFIQYLKDHNAKTVMAVGLFDKDGSKENLVVGQSKAIGFNNYFISSNPDKDALIDQFIKSSEAYTISSTDYKVSIKSQDGVTLSNPKFSVEGTDVPLTLSNDHLSATGTFSYSKAGTPNGTLSYDNSTNSKLSPVTIHSEVTANDKVIDFGNREVKNDVSSFSVKLMTDDHKELFSFAKSDVLQGSSYDVTSVVPDKYVSADGKVYQLTSKKDALKGTLNDKPTKLEFVYKELKSSVTVKFVTKDGAELAKPLVKDNVSIGTDYDFSKDVKDSIKNDKGLYKLTTKDSVKGKINEKRTVISLVYDAVMAPVKISFVDEKGNELKPAINKSLQVDSKYDFSKEKLDKLSKDNVDYELSQSPDNLTGSLTDKGLDIKFVFKEVKKPEAPKKEEPKKAEEPKKVEEPKKEEPKKAEEPKKEEPKKEEPKQESKPEFKKPETPKKEEPKSPLPKTGEQRSNTLLAGVAVILVGIITAFISRMNSSKRSED